MRKSLMIIKKIVGHGEIEIFVILILICYFLIRYIFAPVINPVIDSDNDFSLGS
jgi:hypothetical protein